MKKAFALLRKAVAHRTATAQVRRTLAQRPGIPPREYQVAVYFADGAVNLYQLRQWYRPLQEIAQQWPVVVLSRSATGAQALLADDALPVAFVPSVRHLERFIAQQDIRIVLYVNQNARNFQMFRYGRRWHVFINHGESDKMYMTTNQYKSYDYAFIAGAAARERLERVLWDVDLDRHTFQIGRPQADYYLADGAAEPADRTVVLYAPTWEGDRPSAHYGSLHSHGTSLVTAILASPRHHLIYRPHPRSGVLDAQYGQAHREIVSAINAAVRADPSSGHIYDQGPDLGWQLAAADVAIVDISAMVYDRLALGKPLMVTRPVDPAANIDANGYLGDCEWLRAEDVSTVIAQLDRVLKDPDATGRLGAWAQHYFGDTTPGAASRRFHAAIAELMRRWEEWDQRVPAEQQPARGPSYTRDQGPVGATNGDVV